MSTKKRVTLCKNSTDPGEGKDVLVDSRWDTKSLYQFCGDQLAINCLKLYNQQGIPIELADRIKEGQVIYVSQGERFIAQQNKMNPSNKFRITLLGKGGVGKSCITQRYLRNIFVKYYDPTIEDCHKKSTMIDGEPANLEILDTGGQEDYITLRPVWMKDKDAFIFIYSVDRKDSLDELEKLIQQANVQSSKSLKVLVANKIDLQNREITKEQGLKWAQEHVDMKYFEASAKDNSNIEEIFSYIVRELRRTRAL